MHIENFKVFCDLVENKSFSRAAKLNSITQSAVSQQLRSVEEQLNSVVVDRSQKQFRLTAEGEILYDAAKDIVHRYEQLGSDILASKNIVSGRLHISTIYSVGLHELDPYIKKFLKEFPAVNIRLEYRSSGAVYEDVAQGISDVGLVAFPQKSRHIEVIDFIEDRLVAICAPGHPLAKEKTIQLKDLAEYKFIGFNHDAPTRKAIDNAFRDTKVEIETAVEFDNIETMKRAVEIDTGVALVPSATIQQEAKLGTLVSLEIKGKPLVRPLGILYRKGRILTPAMKHFIETLLGKAV
jgi:DNA-binding transcriptional LysR family regulator